MRRPNNKLKLNHHVICGMSGTGKSHLTDSLTRHYQRAIVFDAKNEYGKPGPGGFHRVTRIQDLRSALLKCGAGPGRYAFVGTTLAEFEQVCKAAWEWGGCALIAEELNSYTHAGKAPFWWHKCITQGRGMGIHCYAVTTRPAESDKTILGNFAHAYCFRLQRKADRKYMADELDCDVKLLDELRQGQVVHLHQQKLTTVKLF